MKKRMASLILAGICMLHTSAGNALTEPSWDTPVGTPIGEVYSTNIVAYVDGMPIRSYNIGGRTAIVMEDLREYGFDVVWDPELWQLRGETREKTEAAPSYTMPADTSGRVVGTVYHTDILTMLNGIPVESYNIGGETAVAIEELGNLELRDYDRRVTEEYSIYQCRYVWDPEARTISLSVLRPEMAAETDFGAFALERFAYRNNDSNYNFSASNFYFNDHVLQAADGICLTRISDETEQFYSLADLCAAFGLTAQAEGDSIHLAGTLHPQTTDATPVQTTAKPSGNTLLPLSVTLARNGAEVTFDGVRAVLYQGKLMVNAAYFAHALGMDWAETPQGHWSFLK